MSPVSGRSFHAILGHLARERTALAPDYPGYGESAPPPAEPPVTVEDYAASVWEVVDAVATDQPIHLVGNHTGAKVAVAMARARAAQVLGIVSISAPVFTAEELHALRERFAPIPLDEEGTRFKLLWERIRKHCPAMSLELAADTLADILRPGERYEWGHGAAFAYAEKYPEELAALRHPVLVLNPQDDLWEHSKRSDRLLHNGRRLDCPDWGHGFLTIHAKEAARLILDFLEEIES